MPRHKDTPSGKRRGGGDPGRGSADELRAFLDGPSRPVGALSYLELHGFLFTVAANPDLVAPSEWLPLVLGGQEPAFADEAQAQQVLGALMDLYNELVEQANTGTVRVPEHCAFRDDLLANLEPDAPISQWSRGFRHGHNWLEESWPEGLAEFDEELAACLMTLSFFSSRAMAQDFTRECGGKQSLAQVAETCRRVFRDAMVSYNMLGEVCRRASGDAARAAAAQETRRARVGRNDACPCGSGKKYKRCCLAAEQHEHGPDCAHEHEHGPGCDPDPHGDA